MSSMSPWHIQAITCTNVCKHQYNKYVLSLMQLLFSAHALPFLWLPVKWCNTTINMIMITVTVISSLYHIHYNVTVISSLYHIHYNVIVISSLYHIHYNVTVISSLYHIHYNVTVISSLYHIHYRIIKLYSAISVQLVAIKYKLDVTYCYR
jgi:hypothetical protein